MTKAEARDNNEHPRDTWRNRIYVAVIAFTVFVVVLLYFFFRHYAG